MRRFRKWGKNLLLVAVVLYLIGLGGLYFGQELFLFHPETLSQDHVFSFQQEFEEVWLEAKDGGKVNALFFKATDPKGVVLHFHGNTGSLQQTANINSYFTSQNLDFFAIDYRSYGKSTGERSVEGFSADAEAAYEYLMARYPENQIRIYGQSLGTGVATPLAAAHRPHSLTLEAPYTAIAEVAAGKYPIFPVHALLKYPFECLQSIPKVNCPVLVLHGTADRVIPYSHGKQLSETAPHGQLVTLEGIGHPELLQYEPAKAAVRTHLAQ